MRVVVTGAGNVGRHLSADLSEHGHQVTLIEQNTDVVQRANSRPNHSLSDGEVRYPAPDPGTRRA